MATRQGDLALLNEPVAQELLHSRHLAKLAYTWTDGTPRVGPIWFHWDGRDIVVATPPKAPKLRVLDDHSQVAVTIDSNEMPYHVLLIRGTATVRLVDGVAPEYAAAAERYFGPEQGRAWIAQVAATTPQAARIAIRPAWVALIDFETRLPSALSS
jgi:PPOX class probable F420-dependent enzyme